ncbi:hypothetical protein [uncultured Tenacibaculum sp.]|uniref:hypothetical protein n=1 Tax=uncultured Tenacibaculum sp. TaxID=174713 RepID=UPI00261E4B74|nr:hypothetical protein [uncultured Tenacibaculum sp.]
MNLEDDILIERFLRDELSEDEKSSFLKRIEDESEFKSNYLLEKQLFESLNDESWSFAENIDVEELKEYEDLYKSPEVDKIKQAIQKASKEKRVSNSKVIALVSGFAAAVALILTLNVFLKADIDSQTLYADNIQIENLPSFVTRSETSNDKLVEAEKLFKAKDYEKALTIFTSEAKGKENSNLFIYKAITEIELGKFTEAELTLDQLIKSDLIDAEKGFWYKGLLYLKSDDKKSAKKVFSKIVKEKLFKSKEAEEILKNI